MGFLDNVTSAVNRGTAAAGRSTEKIKLKAQLNEITKRRQQLSTQLGASLYDATKDNPELRAGREAIYDGIAQCDAERAEIERTISDLDAQANAQATYVCSVCGAKITAADLFCSGCGTPIEHETQAEVVEVIDGPTCSNCGAPISPGDAFCMSCGTKIEQA